METVKTRWGPLTAGVPGENPPEHQWPAVFNPQRLVPYRAPEPGKVDGPTVLVRANHGRWLADCPFCNSAQHASEDASFYCANCLNAAVGHRLLPQQWPKNRAAIEAVLMEETDPAQRSWEPGMSVTVLRQLLREEG